MSCWCSLICAETAVEYCMDPRSPTRKRSEKFWKKTVFRYVCWEPGNLIRVFQTSDY